MNSNIGITGMRPPPRPGSQDRSQSNVSKRSTSSLSSGSNDSNTNTIGTVTKRPSYTQSTSRPATASGAVPSSAANLQNFSRPAPRTGSMDANMRGTPANQSVLGASIGHRPRQHSQGFFEPSLSSSSSLSASQIAAATAMSHLGQSNQPSHERKRSVTGLAPINTNGPGSRRVPTPILPSPPAQQHGANTQVGGRLAATSAANAAYPKSPLHSPSYQSQATDSSSVPPLQQVPPEAKTKERSKMKLFSKPKSIGISKEKDFDRRQPPLPSPNKGVFRPSTANASTTSLLDSPASSAPSIYSSANASTSTLVPATTTQASTEREKEKHRPHFLSRQKNKQIDRNLPLSSASSNSQAVDPSAPQSLYSFAPQSPGAQSSFAKTMSGLDLRHGARALRERKREEKNATSSLGLVPVMSNSSINLTSDHNTGFLGPSSMGNESFFGPPSASTIFANDQSAAAFSSLGNNMGLTGITPDDAWPLLKARILNIFSGEDLRTPVEDFNLLVSVHIRRCVQKRAPIVLVEDLRELLLTGFSSLAQTLRNLPEDRLVGNLVETWHMVYCTILPFVQAVFLPLDLEFRGHGPIMTSREALEFWGAMPEAGISKADERPSSAGGTLKLPSHGEELDVRRITLITFRDTVILPRHEQLMTIFSRLSLDSINAGASESMTATARSRGASNPTIPGAERPGTSGGSLSPRLSSFNSQASTLLDAASNSSAGGLSSISRSRATSNTSAGSFGTSLSHLPSPSPAQNSMPPPPLPHHSRTRSTVSMSDHYASSSQPSPLDPAQVTETVARMLQCVSVLASVQTGDAGQAVVERLTGALKWNWLGRGRTGRQRKGFVGTRVKTAGGQGLGIGASALGGLREGAAVVA